MRIQAWMFTLVGVFFAAMTAIYWLWSKEPAGTTALAISCGMGLMIGYYLLFTTRRIGDQPEDNKEAEISDGAGELGFFSPHSWWPLFLCLSAALTFFGFVIGWWLFFIGLFATLMSMIGFVFQYYRGNFSH
ncbi:cytochrome c oxidase subunit 4 [Sphaerimonospora sp. CA-214678]|uniref:cytochrome c oxidase subunit 4 n=1 Tax=Sphaerimonospora sp. CA-214678 TaxID=3240029 RepID=UPI003D93AD7E